jgi:sulfatase maturation enzyme AslB (radical SAM superfamily)
MLRKAYLEITNVCNLDCSFCPGTKREKRFMSYEDFKTLAGKLRAHTDYIYFHLMGEPLLHPELDRFLDYAGALGFKVIITTNGTLLPQRGELLLKSLAVHKVNISLQSFEANRWGELRGYISGCADFAAKAGERGKLCVLRLWNQNGLDSLNWQIEQQLAEKFPQPWTESRSSRKIADRVFLEPGERFDWPDSGREDMGQSCFCYGLRDQIGVLCDGTVVPCCLDHDGEIGLGNLLEQELDDIMSTDKARDIYNGFSARQAVEPLCRRCGYARRFG